MNMLFYGAPSVGKTTAARILLKQLGDNSVTLNGSLDNGVDVVRELEAASSNCGIRDGPRVFFIDEAEYLSAQAQAGLRVLIEKAGPAGSYSPRMTSRNFILHSNRAAYQSASTFR